MEARWHQFETSLMGTYRISKQALTSKRPPSHLAVRCQKGRLQTLKLAVRDGGVHDRTKLAETRVSTQRVRWTVMSTYR
jgi:hypothetical protein